MKLLAPKPNNYSYTKNLTLETNLIYQLKEENKEIKQNLKDIQDLSQLKTSRRKKILKFAGAILAGKRLKKSIYRVIDQYSNNRIVTKDAFSDFLASLISRILRVGIFTILFAVLPSVLLLHQNILLSTQNEKIEIQNQLTEASRRSS
ncbi:MAG: hypothetical protein AAF734_10900, partial [Bacteroidota bacterium]